MNGAAAFKDVIQRLQYTIRPDGTLIETDISTGICSEVMAQADRVRTNYIEPDGYLTGIMIKHIVTEEVSLVGLEPKLNPYISAERLKYGMIREEGIARSNLKRERKEKAKMWRGQRR